MNTNNVAIVARLKAAGLLDIAERAAKREELKFAHCIEPGEVTGGHRALWRALAAAGQSNTRIAALLGWPQSEIDRELVPAPKPTPAPKSGVRRRDGLTAEDVAAIVEAAVSPLREELRALRATPPPVPVFDAEAWLDVRGDLGREVRTIATRAGVQVSELLSKARGKHLTAVRFEIVAFLTNRGLSQPDIGRFLRRDRASIYSAQRRNSGCARVRRRAA